MKHTINNKAHLKCAQDGVVLVFTMLLLLIIAILTIAFLYLQIVEVDLIASETRYLQAFYLANAGLEKGKQELYDPDIDLLDKIDSKDPNNYKDPNEFHVTLPPNKEGHFYYLASLDSDPNLIIINGIGVINDNTQRTIQQKFRRPETEELQPKETLFDPVLEDVRKIFEYTPLVGKVTPNLQEPLYIKESGQPEAITNSDDPLLGIDPKEFDQTQLDTIKNLDFKDEIAFARRIKENDNINLFYIEEDYIRKNYYSIPSDEGGINSYTLPSNFWNYPEFDYIENRGTEKTRTIIRPEMRLHGDLELAPGTYFFEKLILDDGAKLTTGGNVKIYVTSLKLGKGARMTGGGSAAPNSHNLIIIAEYWEGYPYDSEFNKIDLGPGAQIDGHIFAPNIDVYMHRGGESETKVNGSILTKRLITYVLTQYSNLSGYIRILYGLGAPGKITVEPDSWREVKNP